MAKADDELELAELSLELLVPCVGESLVNNLISCKDLKCEFSFKN